MIIKTRHVVHIILLYVDLKKKNDYFFLYVYMHRDEKQLAEIRAVLLPRGAELRSAPLAATALNH